MTETATDGADEPGRNGRILTVCTGNVCRSPYMERRLAHALNGSGVEVVSAGTGALAGEPIDASAVELLTRLGVRTEAFTARQLTERLIAEADLVLTATRLHRGEVVQLHPRALRYAFTWGDFADLVDGLSAADLGAPAPGVRWVGHVAAAAAARRGTIPPRPKEESDILDPFQQGPEVFDRMAQTIDGDLPRITAALVPPTRG